MKDKKILLLGSKGMLGQMAHEYFTRKNYKVEVFNERFTEEDVLGFTGRINSYHPDIVINCIGRIKQKSSDALNLLWSNTILPLELVRSLNKGCFLVQPSTDCVFSGNTANPYQFSAQNDASDIYGWSKSLAETAIFGRDHSLIVRVSIIGPDKYSDKGLLSWFTNLPAASSVNGFTDHIWNGITTLEWCKQVEKLLSATDFSDQQSSKLVQLGTKELYNKYQMLNIFQEIFETEHIISTFNSGHNINRSLVPQIYSPSLEEQLKELKEFMLKN